METTHRVLFFSGLWLSLAACQPSSPESSSLDHILGQTTRPRSALTSCTKGDATSPAISYMQTLLNKLMSANSGTFQGILAPSKFCLQLDQDSEINGVAYIGNGEIHITSGLLKSVTYDADVAAVLAHELAHVSMNHVYDLENDKVVVGSKVTELNAELKQKQEDLQKQQADYFQPLADALKADMGFLDTLKEIPALSYISFSIDDIRTVLQTTSPSLEQKASLLSGLEFIRGEVEFDPESKAAMEGDSGWQNIVKILDQSDRELAPIRKSIEDTRKALKDIPRDDLIGDGAGASKNWKEQEADEVGYEFYLRAGFRPDRFASIHNLLMAQSRSDKECETLLSSGQLPPRGFASHPSSCWRIHNINQREALKHADAYKPFLSNTTVTVEEGKLETVKDSL
ncbi:M48 family metalloprotease [Oligoflexus tunisiensis]|uniref:M48 family metalloprotease n=1 Tax=Oligoflexus tunisiensis TaxID=708132 RepID=UPI00159F31F7|nr:M48 family metalloprotease [Oligoflexus tunisiensis]